MPLPGVAPDGLSTDSMIISLMHPEIEALLCISCIAEGELKTISGAVKARPEVDHGPLTLD